MKNRAFAALALVLMLLTLLPQGKAGATDVTSGSLGDGITWHYEDGTLTVTGEGHVKGLEDGVDAPWSSYAKQITKLVVGEGIRSTGKRTFNHLTEVQEIQLPSTLEIINIGSFQYCVTLERIEIPYGVKEIQEGAFIGCRDLQSIVIPNSVETLEDGAFAYCKQLTSVKLSEKIKHLGTCFKGCSNLASITLPKSVTRISGTFEYCTNLKEVKILGNLTTVDYFTFRYCHSLESIEFPAGLWRIAGEAFYDCRSLQYIRFHGDFPNFDEMVFHSRKNNPCVIYYPANNTTWTEQRIKGLTEYFNHSVVVKPYGTPECQHTTQTVIPGKAATCNEAGLSEGSTCSSCGKVLKAQTAIAALGHDLMTVTMEPNCTEPGFDLYQCSRCTHRETGNIVQPLGHDYGDWQTITEPTIEAAGLAQRVCATCGEIQQQELEKLSPPPTEPQPTEPATQPTIQPTAPENTIQLVPAEPKDRALASVGVVLVLLAVTGVILIVKWLTRKRP